MFPAFFRNGNFFCPCLTARYDSLPLKQFPPKYYCIVHDRLIFVCVAWVGFAFPPPTPAPGLPPRIGSTDLGVVKMFASSNRPLTETLFTAEKLHTNAECDSTTNHDGWLLVQYPVNPQGDGSHRIAWNTRPWSAPTGPRKFGEEGPRLLASIKLV